MKKLVIMLLSAVLALSMVACKATPVEETKPEPKESLTLEEIKELRLPESYCISVYKGDILWMRGYSRFPSKATWEMLIGDLCDVKPDTLVVTSSGIEDGMIYTLCTATLYGDKEAEFLFINDPVTLEFVAGSVTTTGYEDYTHYLYYY